MCAMGGSGTSERGAPRPAADLVIAAGPGVGSSNTAVAPDTRLDNPTPAATPPATHAASTPNEFAS
jgi:hypothetical protein